MSAPISERVRLVAIAMCEADGRSPYEQVAMETNPGTAWVARWETYVGAANRFLAAMRAVASL